MTDPGDDPTLRVSRGSAHSADASEWPTTAMAGRPGSSTEPEGLDTGGGVTEDDGSTMVARRESRRRQARASADRESTHPGEAGAAGGEAPVGTGDAGPSISAVRSPAPVIVTRAMPAVRSPQAYVDAAAQDAARRRRNRRHAAFAVIAASGVALLAAGALIVLTTMG